MKILATADLHGNLPEIEPCDLLLIAGDICPDEGCDEARQANWLDREFRAWLEAIPAKRVISIAGNHDFVYEHPRLVPQGLRYTYLQDNFVDVEGIRIWGIPWVPHLRSWAFYANHRQLEYSFNRAKCDILLSHGPPFKLLDQTVRGDHVGAPQSLRAIKINAPKVFICGHIHEAAGQTDFVHNDRTTKIINCSYVDETYTPTTQPIEISLKRN